MAGTLTIDTLKASSGVLATQNGMTGIAKAWVNFSYTGTIRGSFNVSSITVSGTGLYIANLTTALPNANYAVAGTASNTPASIAGALCVLSSTTGTQTSTVAFATVAVTTGGPATSFDINSLIIVGN